METTTITTGKRGRRPAIPLTPAERAGVNLFKALQSQSEFQDEKSRELQVEFESLHTLRIMNMDLLAVTLAFLERYTVSPENFKDKIIIPYISRLTPIPTDPTERKRTLIRYKANILKYIKAIAAFRATHGKLQ